MSSTKESVLRRGTAFVMVPVILAAVLYVFWKDRSWIAGAIFALSYIAAAFACLTYVGYRRVQNLEISRTWGFLFYASLALALVSVIASLESVFGQ